MRSRRSLSLIGEIKKSSSTRTSSLFRAIPVQEALVEQPWAASGFKSPTPIAAIASKLLANG
jgi:hypothetical protein